MNINETLAKTYSSEFYEYVAEPELCNQLLPRKNFQEDKSFGNNGITASHSVHTTTLGIESSLPCRTKEAALPLPHHIQQMAQPLSTQYNIVDNDTTASAPASDTRINLSWISQR